MLGEHTNRGREENEKTESENERGGGDGRGIASSPLYEAHDEIFPDAWIEKCEDD